ncbi:MAG: alpha/beta family hydrolase [Caldimonas sp.]
MPPSTTATSIGVEGSGRVSALIDRPVSARACYVFAHGAGAGMDHAFMQATALGLASRGIASLRFQFPSMERGSRRPDAPRVAHAAVRAAVATATASTGLPLFAGGKSFGGRMTSQAQALSPLPGVRGLAFFGFPLHPPEKPSIERAAHLDEVALPMLFVQGTRDELAEVGLLRAVVDRLGARATLAFIDDADHAFHVRKRSGRTDAQALDLALDTAVRWIDLVLGHTGPPTEN